nr:protein kinase-like domain, beta-lactamase/transpeptidase-like protein [Tanacetum cinerariifolium]
MEFLKKKRKKSLIFKVDFEKAYNSINWSFLLNMMNRMGFECKWCKWVEVCLRSSCISILVNGSSMEEFGIERGVRQGDPLSPFLFILATEVLNAIVCEAMANGVFKGVKVCENNVTVCFEEISGLRVNYNKSKIYGIEVDEMELNYMARWMGCGVGDFPSTYLGIAVWLEENRAMGQGRGKGEGEGRDIVTIGEEMDGLGIGFISSCRDVLGDGRDIRFWTDRWMLGEDGEFTVKELARLVEEKVLRVEGGRHETIWNNLVPKKRKLIPTSLACVWKAVIWTSGYVLFAATVRYAVHLGVVAAVEYQFEVAVIVKLTSVPKGWKDTIWSVLVVLLLILFGRSKLVDQIL